MKKSVLCVLALVLCLVLAGCGVIPMWLGGGASSSSSVVTSKEQEPKSDSASSRPANEEEGPAGSTQRVGTAEFGYVSVPEDWVPFVDVEGGTDWQYSNPDGTSIITMNVFSTEGLSEEELQSITPETAAQSVWFNIENGGGTAGIEGAKVDFVGYEAYQVYAAYEDGSILVTWCFETEDGQIHYVAAEGAGEDVFDVVGYLESSWALSE